MWIICHFFLTLPLGPKNGIKVDGRNHPHVRDAQTIPMAASRYEHSWWPAILRSCDVFWDYWRSLTSYVMAARLAGHSH